MKMIIAVIHDEDVNGLIEMLSKDGFQATKMASTGGFLKYGNTTIFVGVEEHHVDKVTEIIKQQCKTKKRMSVTNQPYINSPEGYLSYPVEVTVGGATIFVIDVEQFIKV